MVRIFADSKGSGEFVIQTTALETDSFLAKQTARDALMRLHAALVRDSQQVAYYWARCGTCDEVPALDLNVLRARMEYAELALAQWRCERPGEAHAPDEPAMGPEER